MSQKIMLNHLTMSSVNPINRKPSTFAGYDDGWGLTYGPEGGFRKKAAYYDFKKLLAKVPGEENR